MKIMKKKGNWKPMKMKYIETAPLQREIIFENSNDFWKFYEAYDKEIWEKYCKDIKDLKASMEIFGEVWKKTYFKITKAGKKHKYHYPAHLLTKEVIAKAKVGVRAYLEGQMKKRKEMKGCKPKIVYAEIEKREEGNQLAVEITINNHTFAGYIPEKQIEQSEGKMEKTKKKILIISDDFGERHFENIKELCKEGNYYYHEEDNCFSFDIDLVEDFEIIRDTPFLRRYDAFLIDYGLVGDDKDNLEMIRLMISKGGCVIWCGGLSGKYNKDAKIMFPDRVYMHNLPECSIGHEEIMNCLYDSFKKQIEQTAMKGIARGV
jgi:hypothetical protein